MIDRRFRMVIIFLTVTLVVWSILQLAAGVAPIVNIRHTSDDGLSVSRPNVVGCWNSLIEIPLVAAAVAVLPRSGKVLMWAADRGDVFGSNPDNPGKTLTTIYDPQTDVINSYSIDQTNHDMFCPGLSIDSLGRPIVTGGSSGYRTSIYDDMVDAWISGPNMKAERGYQSQVTLTDGRLFTIGGSWTGPLGGRHGEVYDLESNSWTWRNECIVEPLLTQDDLGVFAADNHAWLFAWSNNSVFQAGPSSALNWYGIEGDGHHLAVGRRSNDSDAMNGNAVMFDALQGRILTVGGSKSYSGTYASNAAHIIELKEAFENPTVSVINSMHHPRAFANSVILPTGEVLVVGGQKFARQWSDANATLIPELWNPVTQSFRELEQMGTARTYHSIAALLPDGRVLTGGGGLCWKICDDETANHFNIQLFSPPYLFDEQGLEALRPQVLNVSSEFVFPGSWLQVVTDMPISELALIRYSSVTHSVNTDQRRVTLNFVLIAANESGYEYSTAVPQKPGSMIPGYWMLFALNNHGVPSIAKTVHVSIDNRNQLT